MKNNPTIKTYQTIRLASMAFAVIVGLAACHQKADSGSRVQGIPTVSVFQVREAPFSLEITASGELLPDEETEIRAPLSGNVMKIHFREGQNVKQGDLLVELDHVFGLPESEDLKPPSTGCVAASPKRC